MNISTFILLFLLNLSEFSKAVNRNKRAITSHTKRLWPYAVIPYEIDENYTGWQKALFKQAMRHWSNYTCIKFIERNNPADHPDYIFFTEQKCGCCSFVGRKGDGQQIISIGRNCANFGTVVHELGHAIGFWHEHTRPDRDHHVNIITDNIVTGQEYNFNKMNADEVDLLDSMYDYKSIMHYAKNTFSKSPYFNTIEPIEKIEIGQRAHLSDGDIVQTNILYDCPKCGATLQRNSGNFTSDQAADYCEWRIEATPGERIELYLNYSLENLGDCENSIELRDGYWYKSPLIGRICDGNSTKIVTNSPRLLVGYSTKNPQSNRFSAAYQFICGGELFVTNTTHLESPNYPDDYPPDRDCIWTITVPEPYQIAIIFESFEIEYHANCLYDSLEIGDGKFCGSQLPSNLLSTTNTITVRFTSDNSLEKSGFSMKIYREFDECTENNHSCSQRCINTLGSYYCGCEIGFELHPDGKSCEDTCGGLIDLTNSTTIGENSIVTPLFPDLYPNNKTCIWEIRTIPDYRIAINFTHFDLEGNNLSPIQICDYDRLEVIDSGNQNVYCGSKLPEPIISETNTIRLVFRSDGNLQKTGFQANYITFRDNCVIDNGGCDQICTPILDRQFIGSHRCSCRDGYNLQNDGKRCIRGVCTFEITTGRGRIISPNFPHFYPSLLDCIWNITTMPGRRIRLKFWNFDLEDYKEGLCLYDQLEIFDGIDRNSITLGKFCGTELPPNLISSGNHMYITFHSDRTISGRGFRAKFTSIL